MIRFITFEGGDGVGKTTQILALEEHLRRQNLACLVTREPGGTALGERIREMLLEVGESEIGASTELFLYLADRSQHVKEVIRPAIETGKTVLCDRFTDSTLVYQGYGRGLDLVWLRSLNHTASKGLCPDLTFLLDCPVELGLARAAQRRAQPANRRSPEDRLEREKIEFHERVRRGFLDLAKAEPGRFRIIDASGSADHATDQISEIVDREMAQ